MKKIKRHLYQHRFIWLFAALVINFFLYENDSFSVLKAILKLFFIIMLTLTSANSIENAKKNTKQFFFFFGLVNIGLYVFLNWYQDSVEFEIAQFILLFLFFSVTFFNLLKQIFSSSEVKMEIIFGAFAGYMLLGIINFQLFGLLYLIIPEAFANISSIPIEAYQQLSYFSFTCLTTLGFGDVLPLHPLSQKLAVFTAIEGQFYLTVVVAILIARYLYKEKTL
ncbi:MAG: ion channel [Sphingobacteriia bacterium]|jgi:hypothetical protein